MSRFTNFVLSAFAIMAWCGIAVILLVAGVVLAPICFLAELGDPSDEHRNYYDRY